jgi:hypothetical protein
MGRPKSKDKAFINLYYRYKVDAKQRGVPFDLTKDQFRALTSNNCTYCNQKPSKVSNPRGAIEEYIYNGIDRYDSNKGYILGNVAPCCETCNYMKRMMNPSEFFKQVFKIYKAQEGFECLAE